MHINHIGCFYIWNNKREGSPHVAIKIDRVMGNLGWME
jgi:hypothetical protein